jgi:hypothetical protein
MEWQMLMSLRSPCTYRLMDQDAESAAQGGFRSSCVGLKASEAGECQCKHSVWALSAP